MKSDAQIQQDVLREPAWDSRMASRPDGRETVMTDAQAAERRGERMRRQTAPARRRCPRCHGNLFISHEDRHITLQCLQCGREFAPQLMEAGASRAA
jgi:ribosomal protein S27AE